MAPSDEGAFSESGSDDIPRSGRVLAIDPGAKRIGLAMSDPTQTIAQPLPPLQRREGKRFPLAALRPHIEEHDTVGILVGLPIAPDGQEDDRASTVRDLGAILRDKTGLPTAFWDERMTTARALAAVREMGGKTRGRKAQVDSLAATVLLQSFLDSRVS